MTAICRDGPVGRKNLDHPYTRVYYTSVIHKYMHAHISISIIFCLSTDIDECANDSSDVSDDGSAEGSQNVCNQICTNTNGSFYCECFHGYQLSDDFMTCVGM